MKLTNNIAKRLFISAKTGSISVLTILLLAVSITGGCSADSNESDITAAETPAQKTQQLAQQEEINKKYATTEENCGPHYKHQHMIYEKTDVEKYESWESCFPREAPLDDKEFWSEPRIMYSFYKEDYKDQQVQPPSLYSMRFDGTDIRLILRSDEIDGDINHGRMRNKAVRSPDNRYIALSFDDGRDLSKVLFDLEEGTRTIISTGGSKSNFIWTQDSENLIFYVGDRQKNYHVPTKTLTNRKIIYSSGGSLYLLNDGKIFMAARYDRLDYSNFEGNKLKTIKLPKEFSAGHGLSLDNKFFYLADAYDGRIFDIQNMKTIYTYENRRYAPSSDSIFLPNTTKIIFWLRKKGLVVHDFATDKYEVLFSRSAKGSFGIRFPSIINHPLLTGTTLEGIGK